MPTVMSTVCELVFFWLKKTNRRQGKVRKEGDSKDSRLGAYIYAVLPLGPQQKHKDYFIICNLEAKTSEQHYWLNNWQRGMCRGNSIREGIKGMGAFKTSAS